MSLLFVNHGARLWRRMNILFEPSLVRVLVCSCIIFISVGCVGCSEDVDVVDAGSIEIAKLSSEVSSGNRWAEAEFRFNNSQSLTSQKLVFLGGNCACVEIECDGRILRKGDLVELDSSFLNIVFRVDLFRTSGNGNWRCLFRETGSGRKLVRFNMSTEVVPAWKCEPRLLDLSKNASNRAWVLRLEKISRLEGRVVAANVPKEVALKIEALANEKAGDFFVCSYLLNFGIESEFSTDDIPRQSSVLLKFSGSDNAAVDTFQIPVIRLLETDN